MNKAKELKLSEEKTEELLLLISKYSEKDTIYPGAIIRKLNLTMKETYAILEKIRENGYLNLNYEVYCFSCSQFTGEVYKTISQMPEEIYCESCHNELHPVENSIAIYKVKSDE